MRQGQADNDVFERLAADERLGLTAEQLATLVTDPITFTGAAVDQVQAVVRRVDEVVKTYPEAAGYTPAEIL
jgi:adenylosuccinate lyase